MQTKVNKRKLVTIFGAICFITGYVGFIAKNSKIYLETFDSSDSKDWTTVVDENSILNTIKQVE